MKKKTMKRNTKQLLAGLLALVLVLTGLPMSAAEVKAEVSGDYEYEVNDDGKSVTITGYNGNGGNVTIPSKLKGKKVTRIGADAFCDCSSLASITIPSSVMSIEWNAFMGCSGLTSVIIPSSVTRIGLYAFAECSSLTSIIIPSSVVDIEFGALGYDEDDEFLEDFVIYGDSGTAAETYANEYGLTFRSISGICKKNEYRVTYGANPFKITTTSKSALTFTSSKPKVASVNKNTGKVTIKGTGVATITVKAGKNTIKVTVKVSPKKQKVKSAKTVKGRKLTVKWAKDKNATGYQVQVSTSKNFKKGVKKKTVSKNSCTFTKLTAGKKYYVRIRSYKKSGSEKLYGSWSDAKKSSAVEK